MASAAAPAPERTYDLGRWKYLDGHAYDAARGVIAAPLALGVKSSRIVSEIVEAPAGGDPTRDAGALARYEAVGRAAHVAWTCASNLWRPAARAALAEDAVCAVCLQHPCRPTRLGCGHVFCLGCILPIAPLRCPLCRADPGLEIVPLSAAHRRLYEAGREAYAARLAEAAAGLDPALPRALCARFVDPAWLSPPDRNGAAPSA
eukprot:tig00021583_g22653.t1